MCVGWVHRNDHRALCSLSAAGSGSDGPSSELNRAGSAAHRLHVGVLLDTTQNEPPSRGRGVPRCSGCHHTGASSRIRIVKTSWGNPWRKSSGFGQVDRLQRHSPQLSKSAARVANFSCVRGNHEPASFASSHAVSSSVISRTASSGMR